MHRPSVLAPHLATLLLVCLGQGLAAAADFCSGKADGRYSDPTTCAGYITCFQNATYTVALCPQCPAGANCGGLGRMAFDEGSQRCVWPMTACSQKCEGGCLAAPDRQLLLVWSGPHNTSLCHDAVFVLDATVGSEQFGKILAVAEAPTGGNEPHHVGLSADGKVFGAGGLLAVLKKQPDLLFFDVSDPLHPVFMATADPPQSSIPDEFFPLPEGGFLVTMMGSASGGSPGRIARIGAGLSVQGEYPAMPPTEPPLNPHGIAVDFKRRRVVTGDYLLPASTLLPTNGPVLRTTFRVWDLDTMDIISTFDAGSTNAAGFMDARMLGDTGVAILGSGKGRVYGVNVSNPSEVKVVHFVSPITNHCLAWPFAKGTRVLATVFGLSLIQLIDSSNPWKFRVIKEVYLPAGSGPHYITLSHDERLAAVSTYFLDEDPAVGVVHASGSRMLHFFDIDKSGNDIVPHPAMPYVDFKWAAAEAHGNLLCGHWRPHGMAFMYK